MPLPALPPNNTARVWFRYKTGNLPTSREHEVMWRYNPAELSLNDVANLFQNFLVARGVGSFLTGWQVLAMRHSAANSIVSLPHQPPVDLTDFVGTGSTNNYRAEDEAYQDVYVGRSLVSGRRVSFSLFRASVAKDDNFRGGMDGAVQGALSLASGQSALLAIDGTKPSWYTYINYQFNSHWEREVRG